jgi:hypothetical protein
MQRAQHDDAGLGDVEIDGAGKACGLVELGRGRAIGNSRVRRRAPQHRLDDERAADCRARGTQPVSAFVATARLQSVLIPGRRFLGALE